MNNWILTGVSILCISFALTWCLRRYALARSILDLPNHRSSHTTPTPRGGGVAIVVSFIATLILMLAYNVIPANQAWAFIGSGAAVAIVGFLDDHGHIAARWRLLGHFGAAAWAIYCLGDLPSLNFLGTSIEPNWIFYPIAALYIVWMLNLYNFMDGIDGIASVQAISACMGASLIYFLSNNPQLALAPIVLGCAVLGFLIWNFPPAKIFMGDAGSGFLGIILAILSLQGSLINTDWLWSWLILLGVFISDATWTLIRRLLRGEKVYEAHRSHAYQHASRKYGRHLPVTLGVLAINALWLLPIAICVGLDKLDGFIGLLFAYAPLVALLIKYDAGKGEV